MLVVGKVGWGPKLHPTGLTPDEQYTHITLWCLLASPLLIGCDMTQLDDFTLGLLTNDEVLAVNQDWRGHQARRIVQNGDTQVWARLLEDDTLAVGLFNLGDAEGTIALDFADLHRPGEKLNVRDLWRQKDLGPADGRFSAKVASHGTVMVKIGTPQLNFPLVISPRGDRHRHLTSAGRELSSYCGVLQRSGVPRIAGMPDKQSAS
jgi:alpha-galactosidase